MFSPAGGGGIYFAGLGLGMRPIEEGGIFNTKIFNMDDLNF